MLRWDTLAPPVSGALFAVTLMTLGAGLGVALGALAGQLWVLGSFALLGGLGLGAAAVFLGHLGPHRPGAPIAAITVALTLAWGGWQATEDHHHRDAFAHDVARSRAADTGLPPEAMARAFEADPEAARAFLAQGSDARLDAEVRRLYGVQGALGRWLLRHDAGLRLASAGPRAIGLSVPWPVSIVVTLGELVGAWLLAWRLWRSAVRLRASATQLERHRDHRAQKT